METWMDELANDYYKKYRKFGTTKIVLRQIIEIFRDEAFLIYTKMMDGTLDDHDNEMLRELYETHVPVRLNAYILNKYVMPERGGFKKKRS